MNKKDKDQCGLTQNEKVDLKSQTGIMENVIVREYDIAQGNIMTYFPESNMLVSTDIDKQNTTPSFKNTIVKIIHKK